MKKYVSFVGIFSVDNIDDDIIIDDEVIDTFETDLIRRLEEDSDVKITYLKTEIIDIKEEENNESN